MKDQNLIRVVTRGSPLALAQTESVVRKCREAFPRLEFVVRIIKTKGDKLQKAALAADPSQFSKGLFTKELERELLRRRADFAVHSLKDLPIDLPPGLDLGAVPRRVDARDVLICRSLEGTTETATRVQQKGVRLAQSPSGFEDPPLPQELPEGAVVGTSSLRRQWQLKAQRPDLQIVPLRGNVHTRLEKLLTQPELDAIVLAKAGLDRLGYEIDPEGRLFLWTTQAPEQGGQSERVLQPAFRVRILPFEVMLPAPGQAALGVEIRAEDGRIREIVRRVDHYLSRQCVTAERTFLAAVGGGCRSPIAAYAEPILDEEIRLTVAAWTGKTLIREQIRASIQDIVEAARQLGEQMRHRLSEQEPSS